MYMNWTCHCARALKYLHRLVQKSGVTASSKHRVVLNGEEETHLHGTGERYLVNKLMIEKKDLQTKAHPTYRKHPDISSIEGNRASNTYNSHNRS